MRGELRVAARGGAVFVALLLTFRPLAAQSAQQLLASSIRSYQNLDLDDAAGLLTRALAFEGRDALGRPDHAKALMYLVAPSCCETTATRRLPYPAGWSPTSPGSGRATWTFHPGRLLCTTAPAGPRRRSSLPPPPTRRCARVRRSSSGCSGAPTTRSRPSWRGRAAPRCGSCTPARSPTVWMCVGTAGIRAARPSPTATTASPSSRATRAGA